MKQGLFLSLCRIPKKYTFGEIWGGSARLAEKLTLRRENIESEVPGKKDLNVAKLEHTAFAPCVQDRTKGRIMVKKKKEAAVSWAFIGPVIVYYLILTLVPIIMVFYYCFTDWNGLSDTWNFVGFDNFVEIFTDPYYYQPLIRTVWVSLIIIFGTLILGLSLAVLMAKPLKGMGMFRTIYYIPCVISISVIAQILNMWLQTYGGTFNLIRESMGLEALNFKRNIPVMWFWIITLCIWKGLGGTIIIFVACIMGIDKQMYEAADLDGASRTRQFFSITLPSLRPMMTFVIVTSVVGVFGIFEPIKLITQGSPEMDGATRVILFSIYEEAFSNFRMGMSNALSVVVFILTIILTWISYRVRTRGGTE